MATRKRVARPAPGLVKRRKRAVEPAAVAADVELMVDAAQELTLRARRCSGRVLSLSERGDLVAAAHAAGQMMMLARIAEQRLLAAAERCAGAQAVLDARGDA